MRGLFFLLILGLVCFLSNCIQEDIPVLIDDAPEYIDESPEINDNYPEYTMDDVRCIQRNIANDKDLINDLIIGKWNWIQTGTILRTGVHIVNPETENESKIFEFTSDGKLNIYVNKFSTNEIITYELEYVVQLFYEGTFWEINRLAIKLSTGSQLFISFNWRGTHLSLSTPNGAIQCFKRIIEE